VDEFSSGIQDVGFGEREISVGNEEIITAGDQDFSDLSCRISGDGTVFDADGQNFDTLVAEVIGGGTAVDFGNIGRYYFAVVTGESEQLFDHGIIHKDAGSCDFPCGDAVGIGYIDDGIVNFGREFGGFFGKNGVHQLLRFLFWLIVH